MKRCWKKHGLAYPRLTKSSRYDEVDAREAVFAFKLAYDRESGYASTRLPATNSRSNAPSSTRCLGVQRRALQRHGVAGKVFVGPDLFYCGLPERDRVHPGLHEPEATYLKRFTFGGTILNKIYHCIPAKSKILYFEPDTPASCSSACRRLTRRSISRPAIRRKWKVKGAKTRAADFHQGRFLDQQTAARLGCRGADDPRCILPESNFAPRPCPRPRGIPETTLARE